MVAQRPAPAKALLWTGIVLLGALTAISIPPAGSAPPHSWSAPAASNPAPGASINEGAAGAFVNGQFYYLEHGGGMWHFDPTVPSAWVADAAPPRTHLHGMATMAHGPGPGGCGFVTDEIFVVVSPIGVDRFHPTCGWHPTSTSLSVTDWPTVVTLGSLVYVFDEAGFADSYDPVTDTWTGTGGAHPAMPIPNDAVTAAVAHGGLAYLFGGENAGPRQDVQIFDPSGGGSWIATYTTVATGAMPTARGWAVAGVCGDEIYVMGGDSMGPGTGNLDTVEIFNTAAPPPSAWSTGPNMLAPQAEMAAGLVSNGAGTMVAMTGWSTAFPGNSDMVQVLDANCGGPTDAVTCQAAAIEVIETDLTGGAIGDVYVPYSHSTASATPSSGPTLLPSGPMDPPTNPMGTGSASASSVSYSNPSLGVAVDAREVYSDCQVYAGGSAHAYGHAGVEDLSIAVGGTTILVAELLDFELNAFGTTSGVQANFACDYAEADALPPPQTAAFCSANTMGIVVAPPATTEVDIEAGTATMNPAGHYDGSVLHVRVTQPGVTQVDIYLGHVTVDVSSYSTAATGPTYIPNGPCLTPICA